MQVPLKTLLLLTTTICCSGTPTSSSDQIGAAEVPGKQRLENREVGYPFCIPILGKLRARWRTEFASGSPCQSVEVIDFQPPPGSGSAALLLRSLVHICAKLLTDNVALEDFLRQTYTPQLFARFQRTQLAGTLGYELTSDGLNRTIFLQTERHRIQFITAVVASPERQAQRVTEIQDILNRLVFF